MGGPGRGGPERSGSSARRQAQVGHRAAPSQRGPARGVAAPSPRRDAAPAASAQAAALTTLTPSTGSDSAAHGDSCSPFPDPAPGVRRGSGSRGNAGRRAPPPRPAGANGSLRPPRTRPEVPERSRPSRPCARPVPLLPPPEQLRSSASPGRPGRSSLVCLSGHPLGRPHQEPASPPTRVTKGEWPSRRRPATGCGRFKAIGTLGVSSGTYLHVTLGLSPSPVKWRC